MYVRRSARLQAKAARRQVVATENSSGKQPSHPLPRPAPAESKGKARTAPTQTPSGNSKAAPQTQTTGSRDVESSAARATSDDIVDWDSSPRLTDKLMGWLLAHPTEAAILFADSDEEGSGDMEEDASRTEFERGDAVGEGQTGSYHDLHPAGSAHEEEGDKTTARATPANVSYHDFDVERATVDETPDAPNDRNTSILQWIATTARYFPQQDAVRVPCASLKHQSSLRDSRAALRSFPYSRPVQLTLTQRMRDQDITYLDSARDEERHEAEKNHQRMMELKQLQLERLEEEGRVLELKILELQKLTGARASVVGAVALGGLPWPICPLTNLPLASTPHNIS